jgi:membrane protein DedA with SNARE-associated domain
VYDLLTRLGDLPSVLIYIVAALLVAGETATVIGLLAPGEATLLLVGFLAYAGTLRLVPTLVIMIAAALVGDALAFRAGRRYGPRLRHSRLGQRVGDERWAKADGLLERLGGRGVFAARWVAFARTLVPRLAGAAGMPYQRFAPWNAVGVATWVGASVLVGYAAGESYQQVSHYLGKATGAVLILIASVVVIVLVGRWLGRNPDPVKALFARAGALPPLRWLTHRYGVLFRLVSTHIGPGWALPLNLAAGLGLLFVIGLALSWLMATVVQASGLSVVDDRITQWFAERRTPGVTRLALETVSTLRPSFLIAAVFLVAIVMGWRSRAWRRDLVGIVSTVGAFVPLVLLAIVASLTQPAEAPDSVVGAGVFPTQNAVVVASLCTLAWLVARYTPWPIATAAWTVATVAVVTVSGARLYIGSSTASESATSVLLGVMWTVVFMVAWATRDSASAGDDAAPTPPSHPDERADVSATADPSPAR